MPSKASPMQALFDAPEALLQPNDALQASTLANTKEVADPLARAKGLLDELHVRDMHIDQIWQQVKMLSERAAADVLRADLTGYETSAGQSMDQDVGSESGSELDESASGDNDDDDDDDDDEDELEQYEDDSDALASDLSADELRHDAAVDMDDSAGSVASIDEGFGQGEDDEGDISAEGHSPDDLDPAFDGVRDQVNDAFFDIDDFNKQLDAMDEDDPYGDGRRRESGTDQAYADLDDEDIDLDNFDDDLVGDADANEIKYEDFFAPPRAVRRTPRSRKATTKRSDDDDDDGFASEEEENEAMRGVQTDLFEVDQSDADDDDNAADDSEDEKSGSRRKLSRHARRQAELSAEIRRLEDENTAPRSWQMSGEAQARARPVDSLLDTELEFDSNRRPVPVITEEVVQDLESMIKARIVADNFDTVLRKVPELAGAANGRRRDLPELSDDKSSKSLAQIYEDEFVRTRGANDPDGGDAGPDAGSTVPEAQRREIEALWKEVSYAIDSLSSWHYTPRPPAEGITIQTDAPAISMEDSQPLALSDGRTTGLAPQEQYRSKAERGEVLGPSGMPVARAEMTTDQRRRERRRDKAKRRNARDVKEAAVRAKGGKVTKKEADRVDALGLGKMIKRGDVKVIGKDGKISGGRANGKSGGAKSGGGRSGGVKT